ncbi:MAG: zinc ribbon domain-containing protein [Candidatus Marinimicrobia bacterium]|jgi:putative FmdB family regulatory protein|nr:zinc ribbon domain-containing protein [Candidatus Neomarinimicrobiota bacterium]MBT3947591.1 zinc ribbon domain-containing protein [Candidatus Neomarinimicrobiota bacterium]MBT4064182.1 zinc ribbon domain-containing protein [Candidatus Neomarinimicrobiota bacterium]MBT4307630.1 zinc ribbon domain-containing protein [Candidatus Neomarinimicrobiota bacterium]MBT4453523.1 zinc ribbon domain-containing protein [Candidatus Neomarinimicrobiota bacterium]
MPTYDYKCEKCDHIFEHFQAMSDAPLTKCAKCDGKIRRLVGGGSGLIFKGSGFYLTDYAKKSKKNKSSDNTKKSAKKKTVKESTKS